MSKHTSGPWIQSERDVYVREDKNGATIARICNNEGDIDESLRPALEVIANARLIAASPELLYALKGLMKVILRLASADRLTIREQGTVEVAYQVARIAIEKAEGREW